MSAIIDSENPNFRAVMDAAALWADAIRGSGVRNADGSARHLTQSGEPLPRCVSDAGEGAEIMEGVHARGRRWDVGSDIEWGPQVLTDLRNMAAGYVKRTRAAMDTGIDISRFRSADDLREALRGPDGDRVALSLTPAVRDDAPTLFFASELTVMFPDLVTVERQMPFARQVLPMRFLNAPGARFYQLNVIDDVGDAQWTADFVGTPPMVGSNRQQILRPLEYMWMGARWSLQEMWQWQQARANGVPLPNFAQSRPKAAREALLRQENLWLFFGGPTNSKILGLLSPDQGIQVTNSAHWSTLTPAALVAVITEAITRITVGGVEVPTHLLLPIGLYNYLATTQWPSTQSMIMGVLMTNLKPLGIQDIVAVPELTYSAALKAKLLAKKYDDATATRYAGGVGGKDAMVVLSRREDKVAGIVSQDIRSLPPEVRSAETTVTLVLGSGGVEVRYPNAHQIVTFNAAP